MKAPVQLSRRTMALVLLIGAGAALLNLFPFLLAQSLTPPGWEFTGNLSSNFDVMQYRVWFRQTQQFGPLVPDALTSEPNQPHLFVLFYYVIAKIAAWLGVAPEFVFAYAGAVLAFALVLVLFATVQAFITGPQWQRWCVFFALLLGGGLGAHLKFFTRFEAVKTNPIVQRMIFVPLQTDVVFEDYRGAYLFTTLFDTHFLLLTVLFTACLLSLYYCLRSFTPRRLVLTTALYAVMTAVHLHEGVLLVLVTGATALFCWIKHVSVRAALVTFVTTSVVIGVVLGWQGQFMTASGIPVSPWRGTGILPTLLFLAYPLAWTLGIMGLGRFWREAGLEGALLLGWALGCTALTLSAPFYPFPARGMLTLQIPIGLVAALAYFRTHARVTLIPALVAIFLLGATPAWFMARMITNAGFKPEPATYLDQEHREILAAVRSEATADDILLARQRELLWLAPDYPGRHYCAHFFLTVDFERKMREVSAFFDADPDAQARFLRDKGIGFLYVGRDDAPERFEGMSQLLPVARNGAGVLFKHVAGGDAGIRMQ